jgi:hypothetical protein
MLGRSSSGMLVMPQFSSVTRDTTTRRFVHHEEDVRPLIKHREFREITFVCLFHNLNKALAL